MLVFEGDEEAGRGIGLAKGATAGATLLGATPPGAAAESWGDFSVGLWTGSGSGVGFTLPQGLVGSSDIFGLGGSGLVAATAGCGAGIVLFTAVEGVAMFTRGSPSCTNQQSLPKLQ